MRILILGGDGYLGWPTALHLSALGHEVAVADNFARRGYDEEMGVESLVPIHSLEERIAAWGEISGHTLKSYVGDLCDPDFTHAMVRDFHPDTIVHFGEQRAAPYSMISQRHAVYTQTNNVVGTLNVMYAIADIDRDIHLVKLGTMGEYGQPNIDIEEGWLEVEHKGRSDRMIYPKRPGSVYHGSKVHDSVNLAFACRIWGMRATDLTQGVVWLAETVAGVYPKWPGAQGEVAIDHVENPRVEIYDHYYKVVHTALESLGLKPTLLSTALIDHLFDVVDRYRDRVDAAALLPTVKWAETASELPRTGRELAKT